MAIEPTPANVAGIQPVSPVVDVAQTPIDPTGIQIATQSSQQIQAASTVEAESAQRTSQATQQTIQSNYAASEVTANVEQSIQQQRAQNSTRLTASLGDINVSINNLLKYQNVEKERKQAAQDAARKQLEAQLKEQQERNKLDAVRQLEANQIEWIQNGKIKEQGTDAYFNSVSEILRQSGVSVADATELTPKYVEPATQYAQAVDKARIKLADDIKSRQREIELNKLKMPIVGSLAQLKASGGTSLESTEKVWSEVETYMRELASNDSFPIETRLSAIAQILDTAVDGISTSNENYLKLVTAANAFGQVSNFATQQRQKFANNEIDAQTYYDSVKQKAYELGIDGYTVPDVNASARAAEEAMKLEVSLKDLQQKGIVDQLETMAARDEIIAVLAIDAATSPAALAELKRAAKLGGDVNAEAAVATVEDWQKYKEQRAQTLLRMQSVRQQAQQVAADFNKWFVNATREGNQANLPNSVAKQLQILQGFNFPVGDKTKLTPEQAALIQQSTNAIINGLNEEYDLLQRADFDKQTEFARSGLYIDVERMKKERKKLEGVLQQRQQEIERIRRESTKVNPVVGKNSTFKSGTLSPIATMKYAGSNISVPFAPKDIGKIAPAFAGQLFGAPRPGRTHAGLDFAVPVGTEVLSMVGGTIARVQDAGNKGYGLNVIVRGNDGKMYLYAHLSGTHVQQGQQVQPGEVIALSGASGVGSGPHLHFEVYDAVGPDSVDAKVIHNPLQHLASQKFGPVEFSTPRSAGYSQSTLPVGAIPLGRNRIWYKGKVIEQAPSRAKVNPEDVTLPPESKNWPLMQLTLGPSERKVSVAQPVRNTYASNRAVDYPPQRGDENWGYTALARYPQLAREINRVAAKYNMPGQWLADVIAYESAGTFSSSISNEWGYTGLIQFGNDVMKDLGVTKTQLMRMQPHEQMRYVDAYLALRLRQSGVKAYKGPEWLVAGINQGNVGIQQVDRYGARAVLDPQNRDGGGTTLYYYMQNLGKYVKRQYRFLGDRRQRAQTVIHDKVYADCALCNQFGYIAFLAHEVMNA